MRRTNTWYLLAGSVLVALVLFVAFFTDAVTTVSPYYSFQPETVMDGVPPYPPGPGHLLGTDEMGRDLWSRVAFGTRWSLLFAGLIMGARMAVALPLAMLAVMGPRWVHWLIDRAYLFTNAVPPLLIYIIILASPGFKETGLLPSITATLVLLTFMEWPRIAMVLRGRMEEVLLEPYIEGATAVGASRGRIFWVHMMPHVWPTLVQVMTEEMGRGLINIGQLGFFRIWVGGGIQEVFDTVGGGGPPLRTAAGIPEWGTMLGGAREYMVSAPWIPLAPALAFLVSITGLNLLSQGLEGALVSMTRVYDSVTPRLRRALAVLTILAVSAGVYWYNGGTPWGKRDGILAMMQEQQTALQTRDLDRYAATLLQGNSGNKAGQMQWLDSVPWEKVNAAVITPVSLRVVGRQAYGTWHVDIGFPDDPPIVLTRKLRLVRRNGTWYDTGEAFTTLRGRHADLNTFYDPNDPTILASGTRYDVNMAMAAADFAYEDATAAVPWLGNQERIQMWLYSSHLSFEVSVQGLGGRPEPGATVWHGPDGGLHISPSLLHSRDRKAIRQALAVEMIKHMVSTSKSQVAALPITLGSMELAGATTPYDPLISVLAGHRLYTAAEMSTLPVQSVQQERGPIYLTQAAVLVQYLQERLGQTQVDALLADPPVDPLAALAQVEGRTPAEAAAGYEQYLWERLSARSVLKHEAGRRRIPTELEDAVTAWAEAGTKPDPAAYLALATPGNRKEHLARHQALQSSEIKQIDVVILDATSNGDLKSLQLLERYTYPDGHTEVTISVRDWVLVDDAWLAYTAEKAWEPAGRETP